MALRIRRMYLRFVGAMLTLLGAFGFFAVGWNMAAHRPINWLAWLIWPAFFVGGIVLYWRERRRPAVFA